MKMNSFKELFLANLKIIFRNHSGLFWSLAVPLGLYIALAVLPIPNLGFISYKNFALPGIITYVIMQGGIYTLAYWLIDLKSRGVIKRFLATPIKNSELILSVIAARLCVTLLQSVLITLVGIVFFGAQFAGNLISCLVLILLGSGIFLCIGLLVSNYAGSYEAAAPITSSIGMPFAFLGNLFLPVVFLPNILQTVSKFLPVTYLSDGLRQAYLYAFDFEKIGKDILILSLWLLGILLITLKVFKLKE